VNEMANKKMMNGKLDEEYAQLREDPYFPEKLPKIFNLLALLDVTTEIIMRIIEQVKKPLNYDGVMRKILNRTKINILNGERKYILRHYKIAASQVYFAFNLMRIKCIKRNSS